MAVIELVALLILMSTITPISSILSSANSRSTSSFDWSAAPIQKYSGEIPLSRFTSRLVVSEKLRQQLLEHHDIIKSKGINDPKRAPTTETPTVGIEHLNLVYIDEHMVVVNKPSGIRSVPGPRRGPSILDVVYDVFGCESDNMDKMVVHRLDMDTSGLVVFARTNQALRCLHEDFRIRQVRKKYIALVCGHLGGHSNASGEIDLPLERDPLRVPWMRVAQPNNKDICRQQLSRMLDPTQPDGFKKMISNIPKDSLTYYDVLSHEHLLSGSTTCTTTDNLPVSRILLFPMTGRTHQLRVHCAALGHPIIADSIYGCLGDGSRNAGFDEQVMEQVYSSSTRANLKLQRDIFEHTQAENNRLHLHATELSLWHPFTRAPIIFSSPPPF